MLPVTFCIKTFERPEALRRLVASIREFYHAERIIVADDSQNPNPGILKSEWEVDYLSLEHDTGLSEGRNRMVDLVETPFLVMLDDDFVFIRHTKIETFIPYLENQIFDLLGGALRVNGGKVIHFEGWLEQINGTLHCSHRRHDRAPMSCDIVLNFFGARTEVIRRIRWDSDLKLGEHLDFYLRLQEGGARVGYHPRVICDHIPWRSKAYNGVRHPKAKIYRALFQKKRGIHTIAGNLSQP